MTKNEHGVAAMHDDQISMQLGSGIFFTARDVRQVRAVACQCRLGTCVSEIKFEVNT